jgi:LPS-assembly lipoprotein
MFMNSILLSRRQGVGRMCGYAAAAASIALLPACGFALRQASNLPFNSLYAGFSETSSIGQELKRALEASGVRVISDSRQLEAAQVILDVLQDQREKIVVGVNASGQVREFQLRMRWVFRLRGQDGQLRLPETELLQQRDFSFNESGALSREAEEALIYRSMQSDIVQQALRRLSAIPPL